MERNPNDGFGASDASQGGNTSGFGAGSSSDAGSLSGGALGGSTSDSSGYGAAGTGAGELGSTAGERSYGDVGAGGAGASPRDRVNQAREKAGQALGQARERAGELKATLADRLESGADRLRQRSTTGTGGTMAAAGVDVGTTEVAAQRDPMAQVNDRLATGMKASADWLRNNDLDSVKASLENEVKTNPGRSLLVAAVAGYLLGKAFRR
jgi:hypothetical protein